MKKEFVTYEIALKLKELEFDEECCGLFRHEQLFPILGFEKINSVKKSVIAAPLWQQAINFFREKYDIHINVISWSDAAIINLDGIILGNYQISVFITVFKN